MQFHFHANQSHFHKNAFALRLALKQRHKGTRKWPIAVEGTSKLTFELWYLQTSSTLTRPEKKYSHKESVTFSSVAMFMKALLLCSEYLVTRPPGATCFHRMQIYFYRMKIILTEFCYISATIHYKSTCSQKLNA